MLLSLAMNQTKNVISSVQLITKDQAKDIDFDNKVELENFLKKLQYIDNLIELNNA